MPSRRRVVHIPKLSPTQLNLVEEYVPTGTPQDVRTYTPAHAQQTKITICGIPIEVAPSKFRETSLETAHTTDVQQNFSQQLNHVQR